MLNGKCILVLPKDIDEVKNAYEIYGQLDEFASYSVGGLLTAHSIMTHGFVQKFGMVRTRHIGIVDSEGHVFHFGMFLQYIPELIIEILDWTKCSEMYILI